MKVEDIDDEHKLSNGAVIQRHSFACEVCESKGEEPAASQFIIMFDGQQVHACPAHVQDILDMEEDKDQKEKGEFFKSFFGVQ